MQCSEIHLNMRNPFVVLLLVWACGDAMMNDDTLQRLQRLEQRMSQVENNIPTWRMDNRMEGVPLGTIVAWTPQMSCSGCFYVDVPRGWQRCDGSIITDQNSPWVGLPVPDLNLSERFIRGGPDGRVLWTQDDQMQDHIHIDEGHDHTDSGHSHLDSGHSHSDSGHNHGYYDNGLYTDGDFCSGRYWHQTSSYRITNIGYANIQTGYANIRSSSANIQSSSANIGLVNVSDEVTRVGEETRPKSMYVVYIVKIAEYLYIPEIEN